MIALGLAGCSPLSGAGTTPTGHGSSNAPGSASVSPRPAAIAPGSTAAKVAQAQRTHEYPGPSAGQSVPGGALAPAQAVRAFAQVYINWTAATVTDRLRVLAALSVGQARSAMSMAAAQAAGDYELRRGGVANSGTVEAVAPVRGAADQFAVVTRELTTAANTNAYQGLRPAWHVALATVTHISGAGWVLSSWQPEN